MVIIAGHILFCTIYLLLRLTYDRKRKNPFPPLLVFLLPFFGFFMYLADRFWIERKNYRTKELYTEKLKVTDEKYKHLSEDTGMETEKVLPFGEALRMEDEKLRRSLILDILRKNPENYMGALTKAKESDDVEVTHYATTTLLEIQSGYEQKLQKFQQQYHSGEREQSFLKRYADCLKHYADSGLIDGSVLAMQQEKRMEILELLLQQGGDKEEKFCYIETALDLKKYKEAEKILARMKEKESESERWNQLAVRFYWEMGETEQINGLLSQIWEKKMYLSKEGKEWFCFWSKGQFYEKETV